MMRQAELIDKIKLYLDSRPDYDWHLPDKYDIDLGLCSGLVALWLQRIRTSQEKLIMQELAHVLNWQPNAAPDKEIEHFINAILFLQRDSAWRHGIAQNNLAATFELLFDPKDLQISEPEFSATFVYDESSLESLLKKTLNNNKMLRVASHEHVVGIIKRNGKYFFYDPNYEPVELNNISKLVDSLIESLGDTALHLDVYDLVGVEPSTTYPVNYAAEMLRNADLEFKVTENKDLFLLASLFSDYVTLDNLFDKDLIDKNNARTEIIQAIAAQNTKLLRYLIKKGIKIDSEVIDNELTPLGNAINSSSVEMVCILLDAGVDPNHEIMRDMSALDLAILKSPAIAAILIATGAKLTKQNKKDIKKSNIIKNAVEINACLLEINETKLETADIHAMINYLLHLHFKKNLELKLERKELAAVETISKHYQQIDQTDLICLEEKAKLHELLESLHVRGFSFQRFDELSRVFDAIVDNIKSKPFLKHTIIEVQEISVILATIDDFLKSHVPGMWSTTEKRNIINKANTTKESILQYLKTYEISDINQYSQQRKIGMYFGKINNTEQTPDTYSKLQPFIKNLNLP